MVISSIGILLVILFLILFAIRTVLAYRLSRRLTKFVLFFTGRFIDTKLNHCRERQLQITNPCLATLTTGGLMRDQLLTNGSSFVRPIGHRIYVPLETSLANATRFQANLDDDEKKQMPPPPEYVPNLDDLVLHINAH